MKQHERLYLALLLGLVGLVVLVELLRPTPPDWRASYMRDDTRAYASQIPYEVLPSLLPDQSVVAVERTAWDWLFDVWYLEDLPERHTYLFIAEGFAPSEQDAEMLLDFVAEGNTVFAAATDFGGPLRDSLGIAVDGDSDVPVRFHPFAAPDTAALRLVNPAMGDARYVMPSRMAGTSVFARLDTARTIVLGVDGDEAPVYVRVEHGEGQFLLSTTPLAFTNYGVLNEPGAGFLAAAWSYLPEQDVWWDGYYKPLRRAASTPLRFILSTPALRSAYWLAVVGALLFVVFQGKRRQRIVPVVEPLRNTSVDFVRTVGRLYHQHADHGDLVRKQITHLRDYLHNQLRLSIRDFDDEAAVRVATRTGVPLADVRTLFDRLRRIERGGGVEEAELGEIHRQLRALQAGPAA